MIFFHLAPVSARGSIKEHGLRAPGDGEETSWGESDGQSVYLFGTIADARDWAAYSWEQGHDEVSAFDVWQVELPVDDVTSDSEGPWGFESYRTGLVAVTAITLAETIRSEADEF
jgi:hypothetical protein